MSKKQIILALDQGTTGSTAALFCAETLELLETTKVEFPQHFPGPGMVEHAPDEIWASVLNATRQTLENAKRNNHLSSLSQIAAVGITNQRETVVALNRMTGETAGNALVWQDRRTADRCDEISKDEHVVSLLRSKTGLVVDPYFSATKMEWLLRHNDTAARWAKEGTLSLLTIDAFLLFKLTGGVLATEDSNASRTMVYDLSSGLWDAELLSLFKIPHSSLPEIRPSASLFGKTKGVPILPDGIPITGMLGDQQAALFAHGGFKQGLGKITFGTGAFLLVNIGDKPIVAERGILTTVAYRIGAHRAFALEGSAFIAGAAIQFIRDNLKWISHSSEIETFAQREPRDGDLFFVPAFTGLGAPLWNPHAKGVLFGLSRKSSQFQIARAILESIALQNVSILDLIQEGLATPLTQLGVDGGAAKSDYLMQFQADVARVRLVRGAHTEMTALGAARVALQGLGGAALELHSPSPLTKEFVPQMKAHVAKEISSTWKRAEESVNQFYRVS